MDYVWIEKYYGLLFLVSEDDSIWEGEVEVGRFKIYLKILIIFIKNIDVSNF